MLAQRSHDRVAVICHDAPDAGRDRLGRCW
jgi:nanoRNase/pAp phosphatase (c-di-AMP/oligoRNAs hydrolase)